MTSNNNDTPQKTGMLVVGLGGNNGVTLLAGCIANSKSLEWETQTGRNSANWYGCITQLEPRGQHGGVGFKGRYNLSDAANMAVSGWDIRPTKLGDALYESRVLDYDLVRQVRDEMNDIEIMKGVYDASFVGESQHATATHIVSGADASSFKSQVEKLRSDIRAFKEKENVDGHITVIWSASVERIADVDYNSADELLHDIYESSSSGKDISPSILYAVAAALEGCSFVNGGSQNTLSGALSQLFDESYRSSSSSLLEKIAPIITEKAYLLGTDFKAGQTKFKTAAVEYIRALGLRPKVIASSNHLGNNDMLNLTSKKTVDAKMRVKSDIFGPWSETQLDHQVKVMYTPYIGDEKRDVVEYTSLGFLGCAHTMMTYTRCMDSVLCVPLMIDVTIWCDYLARKDASPTQVGRATAYLFKVPEGGAKGVDPGFHKQMNELEEVLQSVSGAEGGSDNDVIEKGVQEGIITKEQADSLRALMKK